MERLLNVGLLLLNTAILKNKYCLIIIKNLLIYAKRAVVDWETLVIKMQGLNFMILQDKFK